MTKEIQLTKGRVALVDDDDYEYLSQWNWQANFNRNAGVFYARRNHRIGGRQVTTWMHRLILDAKKGQQVDHQNHDTLDNRKKNIRIVTHKENNKNKGIGKDNTSGVLGVWWRKDIMKWSVRIVHEGRRINLGCFDLIHDAIKVKKKAELDLGFHSNHGAKVLPRVSCVRANATSHKI